METQKIIWKKQRRKNKRTCLFFSILFGLMFGSCQTLIRNSYKESGILEYNISYDSLQTITHNSKEKIHVTRYYFKSTKKVCETKMIYVKMAAHNKTISSTEIFYFPSGKIKHKTIEKRNGDYLEIDYDESGYMTEFNKKYHNKKSNKKF